MYSPPWPKMDTELNTTTPPPGRLWLIPNTLDLGCIAEDAPPPDLQDVLPMGVLRIAAGLTHWIAENAKTTRAFLKRVDGVVPLSRPLQEHQIQVIPRPGKGRADKPRGPAAWRELLAPALAGLVLALVVGGALIVWALLGPGFRTGNNLLAGIGIGAVIAAMWWISGGMGYVPEHPETLEPVFLGSNSGRMESLTFTAPMAFTLDWLIYFSDTSKVLTFGVVTVVGVVAGALVCALIDRSFRWEGFRDTQDTALHLTGAVCMGVGGVTALGCTVGQGLSGLSTLSLTSAIAVAGIIGGAVLGFRFQMWLLERE